MYHFFLAGRDACSSNGDRIYAAFKALIRNEMGAKVHETGGPFFFVEGQGSPDNVCFVKKKKKSNIPTLEWNSMGKCSPLKLGCQRLRRSVNLALNAELGSQCRLWPVFPLS